MEIPEDILILPHGLQRGKERGEKGSQWILQPREEVVLSPFPLAFLLSPDKEGKSTFPDLFPTRNFYFPAKPSTGKREGDD